MSYQVLARKWRPRAFAEMVGQDHVVRALTNALDEGRVHHAFLFTGTRGIGKTSIARIFAKALNCERGVSSKPCGECAVCADIDGGRYVDLIEVDAASRTKADDTRDLMDTVQYAPAVGRYKVYLIDEVHMFSSHSFNALLKTLEEPPPHVKFLLATTDPRKLPVTVLSRCLQFNLRRVPSAAIAEHLASILTRESIEFEPAALASLARAADGSLRDSLSILDQAIAYGGGRVGAKDVAGMLGSVDQEVVSKLLSAVSAADARACLAEVAELNQHAPDYLQVLGDMSRALQLIAVRQIVDDVADDSVLRDDELARLAETMAPEDVQLNYQIALHGRRDLPLSPDPRGAFEMTLLRMLTFRPGGDDGDPPVPSTPLPSHGKSEEATTRDQVRRRSRGESPGKRALQDALSGPSEKPPQGAGRSTPEPASIPAIEEAVVPPPGEIAASTVALESADWDAIVASLEIDGMPLQLARHARLADRAQGLVRLELDRNFENLRNAGVEKRLSEALGRRFGESLRLEIVVTELSGDSPAGRVAQAEQARLDAAVQSVDSDPHVAELKSRFGASVNRDSIRPLD